MFLSQSKDQVAFISHVSLPTVTVYSLSHSYHLHPNLYLYLPVSERKEHEEKKSRANQNLIVIYFKEFSMLSVRISN